jgi:hypothetical protein
MVTTKFTRMAAPLCHARRILYFSGCTQIVKVQLKNQKNTIPSQMAVFLAAMNVTQINNSALSIV